MIFQGGCACGALRYRLTADTRPRGYACHCTDCQTQSGSAFGEQMPVPAHLLAVTGEMRSGSRTMPSGAIGTIHYCAQCATRIYAENSNRRGLATLRVGTLDDAADFTPVAHFWTRSKQPWVVIPDDAISLDTQPEREEDWLAILYPERVPS